VSEQISQRELRNDSGRIMRGLDEGRTYVVTRRSEPVGELRPLRRRRLIDARVAVEIFRGAPPVDLAKLRADLDHGVDQEAQPRG
jgi:antitoxin (DNA-binding transcriptional repressor) of toxin-antitoxin stability system